MDYDQQIWKAWLQVWPRLHALGEHVGPKDGVKLPLKIFRVVMGIVHSLVGRADEWFTCEWETLYVLQICEGLFVLFCFSSSSSSLFFSSSSRITWNLSTCCFIGEKILVLWLVHVLSKAGCNDSVV